MNGHLEHTAGRGRLLESSETSRHLAPSLLYLLLTYLLSAFFLLALASEAWARPPGKGLILRFKGEGQHALLESAEALFAANESFADRTTDASNSLDDLHARFGVRGIRALFRDERSGSLSQQRARLKQRLSRVATLRRTAGTHWPDLSHVYRVQLSEDADTEEAIAAYTEDPHVAWVQRDHTHELNALPNDPYLTSAGSWGQFHEDLWGLHRIRAPEAWEISTGDGVVVAVVDTGVDYNHPDIAANMWVHPGEDINGNGRVDPDDWNGIDDDGNGFVDDLYGFDFANSVDRDGDGFYDGPLDESDSDPFDDGGHGTHVAGTIAAVGDNGIGIIGVAPDAQIMALKGFPMEGSGLDSDLWRAVLYAAMNGADVVNNSWSCRPYCPNNPLAEETLEIVRALGVVVVTSAGNSQRDAVINSPENLADTITVGSSGYDDRRSPSISNYGWVVDIMAPGGGPNIDPSVSVSRRNILSLRSSGLTEAAFSVDDFYLRWAGTSMATPHVSGAVALLLAQRPDLDYQSIRRILRQSATDLGDTGHDYDTGAGRLDVRAALEWTDLPAMQARLATPRNWSVHPPGEDISIAGAVLGPDLQSWSLEVGAGPEPTEWTLIASGTEPKQGLLAEWSTDELEQDAYVIRLSAESVQGQTYLEFAQISLESNSFVPISSPGQPALAPDIAYPWVVWTSRRDPKNPLESKEDRDLFATHIKTGREIALAQTPREQVEPSIWAQDRNLIVSWGEEEVSLNERAIRGCKFSAANPLCEPFTVSEDPSIFQASRSMAGHIVWLQDANGRRDLLSCRVSRDGSRCEPADLGRGTEFGASFPAGTGDTLVWTEFGNGLRFGFCEMNADTGLCPRIEVAEGTPALSRGAASGNLLAWVGYSNPTTGPLRLCEVDRETGDCPWIQIDRSVPDLRPQLSGNRLVWEDTTRNENADIYFCEYDRLRQRCPVQRLTAHMATQNNARIDGDWIVWEDEREGSTMIHGIGLPRLEIVRIPKAREGKLLRLRVRARDPMGGPLELSLESPDGANLEELGAEFLQAEGRDGRARGQLRWRPTTGQAGHYTLTFSATTAGGIVVRQSIEIEIEPARAR